MKKLFTAKYLPLLMLLSLLGGKAEARHYDDGYYVEGSNDCCPSSCYECSCNPLYCGAWDVQVQAGVAPITWRNRGGLLGVNCDDSCSTDRGSTLITLSEHGPKFSKFFRTPWIVGGQVGYHLSENSRVYLEVDFLQARAKKDFRFDLSTDAGFEFRSEHKKFSLLEVYVGARYYWDRWCDRASFFLGGKIGFNRHRRIHGDFTFVVTDEDPVVVRDRELFHHHRAFAGGFNIGLDYCICGNLSIVLTAEVVASCGPNTVPVVLPVDADLNGFSNLILGRIGTELRFPITLGLRYSF